jgi:hypothetical protein
MRQNASGSGWGVCTCRHSDAQVSRDQRVIEGLGGREILLWGVQ